MVISGITLWTVRSAKLDMMVRFLTKEGCGKIKASVKNHYRESQQKDEHNGATDGKWEIPIKERLDK